MKWIRKIAVLVSAAAVTLFAMGCDSDADPEGVASDICSYEAACYEEEYDEQFPQGEMNACEEEITEIAEDLQDRYGQECLNAYDDWVSCGTGLACDDDDMSQCAEQEEAFDEICVGALEETVLDACLKLAECDFGIDEQDCHADGGGGNGEDLSAACEDAIIDYNECIAGSTCDEINDHYDFETENSPCDSEQEVVSNAC